MPPHFGGEAFVVLGVDNDNRFNQYHRMDMMTPAQVANLFGVTVQTVADWADAGTLACIRTPGGQRRYRRTDVEALLSFTPTESAS
jgi:excisionase family DNA binding protein